VPSFGWSTASRNAAGLALCNLVGRFSRGKHRARSTGPRWTDHLLRGIAMYHRKDAMQRHLKTKRHEGAVVPPEFLT